MSTANPFDYDAALAEIMATFDFGKVHRVMVALDWHWYGLPTGPDFADIRKTAEDRLREAVKGIRERKTTRYSSQSGGFCATATRNHLHLAFIAEESS